MGISVTDPITPAIERAKLITFGPFDLSKWFVLGFVAFLVALGEGGGGNFHFPQGARTTPAPAPMPMPAPPSRTFPPGFPSTPAPQPAGFSQWWNSLGISVAVAV